MVEYPHIIQTPFAHPSNLIDQHLNGMFNSFYIQSGTDVSYYMFQFNQSKYMNIGIVKHNNQNNYYLSQKPKNDLFNIEYMYDG